MKSKNGTGKHYDNLESSYTPSKDVFENETIGDHYCDKCNENISDFKQHIQLDTFQR